MNFVAFVIPALDECMCFIITAHSSTESPQYLTKYSLEKVTITQGKI